MHAQQAGLTQACAYCIIIAANSQESAALTAFWDRPNIQACNISAHLLLLSLNQLSQGDNHLSLVGGCFGDCAPPRRPPLIHTLVCADVTKPLRVYLQKESQVLLASAANM